MKQPRNIRIDIKTPCSESTENMKTNDLGYFCQSCSKQVVDFTGMTDEQIVAYFTNTSGRVCGKFARKQLKTYSIPTPVRQVSLGSRLIIGSFISLATATAMGQNISSSTSSITSVKTERAVGLHDEEIGKVEVEPLDTLTVVKGRVMEGDNPIPFAVVRLVGSEITTLTDIDGYFKLEIPEEFKQKKQIEIRAESVGFENSTVKVNTRQLEKEVTLRLEGHLLLGEVIIVDPKCNKKD